MSPKSRIDELKNRIFAVELLTLLKKKYNYKKLSELLDLPIPVLSRYVNGHVLPNKSRSEKIISLFKERYLIDTIRSKIICTEEGFYDLSQVIHDIVLQKLISKVVFNEFNYVEVDRLLTVATGGIPVAVEIANEFNVDIVIAKKSKDPNSGDLIEHKLVRSPSIVEYLYVPRRAIRKGNQILLVDDIIRSGKTIHCLAKLAERMGGNIVGVFAIATIGDVADKLKNELGLTCQIKYLVNLP